MASIENKKKGYSETDRFRNIPGGTDWEMLHTPLISAPALNLYLQTPGSPYSQKIGATLYKLEKTESGQTTQLIIPDAPSDGEVNGVFGYDASEAVLKFSCTLVSDFRVEVESWDQKIRYSLSQSDLEEPYLLPLADFPARYTIFAVLEGENGAAYNAVFRFDVGDT